MRRNWSLLTAAFRAAAAQPFTHLWFLLVLTLAGSVLRPLMHAHGDGTPRRFLIGALAQALGTAALPVLDRWRGRQANHAVRNYLLAALCSASISTWLNDWWVGAGGDALHLLTSAFNAAVLVVMVHAIMVLVPSIGRSYAGTLARLEAARSQLRALVAGADAAVRKEHESLAMRAQGVLGNHLRAIQRHVQREGDVESQSLVEALRSTIDSGLRPLTRDILGAHETTRPRLPAEPRLGLMAFPRTMALRDVLRPDFLIILPFPFYLSAVYQIYGLSGLLPTVIAAVLEYAALQLAIALSPRRPMARANALLAVTGLPILAALAESLVIYRFAPPHTGLPSGFAAVFVRELGFAPVYSLALAYGFSMLGNLRAARAALQQAERDLTEALVRQSQQLWVARQRWAYHIHGSVQSLLTAAILGLQDPPVDWVRVRSNIDQAIDALNAAPALDLTLDGVVSRLQQAWTGSCEIRCKIDAALARDLDRSPQSLFTLNEVLKEAVSNAVRHSQSREVDIALYASDGLLHVEVSGPTAGAEHQVGFGLGTELYDEVAVEWSLSGNHLRMLIPLT